MSGTMSRRQLLKAMGMASVSMAVLAACQPVNQAPAASDSAAAPSAAKRKISVWDYDPAGTDLWVAADQQFADYFAEQHPDIEVERTVSPFTGFTEKFLTSIAGGAKYDVIYGWVRWLPQFIENNAVTPLEDLLANDGEVTADDFFDGAKETVGGNLYGLAWYVGPNFMYYNRSRTAEAGLPDPRELDAAGNWDYAAYFDFVANMTGERDGAPVYGADMTYTRYPGDINAIMRNYGSSLWDEGFTRSNLDSDASLQIWTEIQRIYNSGQTPPAGAGEELGWPNAFNAERTMSMASGPNYTRLATQGNVTDLFDIGQVRMPAGPNGQEHVVYLNSYYMGSSGENQADGWTWFKERSFSDASAQFYLPIGAGRFSARKSIAPATEFDWEDTEVYESIRPVMRTYDVSPKEAEFEPLFLAMRDEILLNQRPVAEILAQYAADATALLAS